MDSSTLMVSFLFGMVGMGMLIYGKKAGRMVPMGAGLALVTVPYFIPNAIVSLIVCGVLTGLPFVVRDA